MAFTTFDDAKKRLGKTDEELKAMIDKKELRAFRDGATWKFREEDIDAIAPAAAEADAGDTLMSIDADILFAEEEEVPADSAAETWIAADTEGVFPGGGGPGSEQARGLEQAMTAPEAEPAPLALSPETDESSLGAVLSDEELGAEPAGEPVIAVDAESGVASVMSGTGGASVPSHTRIVTLVEPPAHHAEYTFMLVLALAGLGVAAVGFMAAMTGGVPSFMEALVKGNTPMIVIGVTGVLIAIAAVVGFILGKQRAAREAMGG